ncbi:MAG: FAD-dependent oxidoreductase, partial [Candidatus Acidiferrum sp.]
MTNNSKLPRRDFIKFVVAGSVASGCPIDHALLADPPRPSTNVEGEHFAICHQIRDGHSFPKPDATRKVDIAIVGGGMAGLSAAYFLRGKDWLLLEKEDHF